MKKVKDTLLEKFEERREKNKRYSLRAFARDIKIDQSILLKYLKGKRHLNPEKTLSILKEMGIPESKAQSILDMENFVALFANFKEKKLFSPFAPKESIQGHWAYFAVLNCLDLLDFDSTPGWIAQRLGIEERLVEKILLDLEANNLATGVKSGSSSSTKKYTAGSEKDNEIRKSHLKSYLVKALQFITNNGEFIRKADVSSEADTDFDFSAITFTASRDNLPEAKKIIEEFRKNLAYFLCSDDSPQKSDDVYHLSIQLFPLTKPKNKD